MVTKFTLGLVKPDAFCRPFVFKTLYDVLKENGIQVCMFRDFLMDMETAEKFYAEHKGKFYYDRLVFNITSGTVRAHVLEGNDIIKRWRSLIGPTKVNKLHFESDNSLRSNFGLSDTRNSFHGSDSPQSALREIKIIFPDFDPSKFEVEHSDLLYQLLSRHDKPIC